MMIELDVSAPWVAPEPPIRRERSLRRLIAGLMLLGVLTLTGGARASTSYEPLYSVDGNAAVTLLTGGRLFVIRDGSKADSRLTAYRVGDGAVLWSTPISISGSDLLDGDDKRLLTIESESAQSQTIAARDMATGRVVWQRTGLAIDEVVGHVLVAEATSTADHPALYGIDMDTGAVTWTLDSADGTVASYLYRDANRITGLFYAIARLTPDRVVRTFDLTTGAVIGTTRLADDGEAGPTGAIDKFDIIDGTALASLAGGPTIAFDAVTGAYRWRLPGNSDESFTVACGAVICYSQGQKMTGLDPATGRAVWTFDQWNWVSPLDGRHIVVNRLTGDLQPIGGGAIFDVTTGTVSRPLDSWRLISSIDNRLLVWRPDLTSRNGDALVGILDPAGAAVSVIAHASEWYSQPHCRVSGRYLACNNQLDIAVWRMP